MTVNYTLARDGDNLEKRFWRALSKHWPNYEILWQLFIAPMTMRVYDRRDTRLRSGMDPRLERLCMAHYSVFHHLARAHAQLVQLQRETRFPQHYDDIFFHMSAATEMVDRFLLALRQIQCQVEGQEPAVPLAAEEVAKRANAFYKGRYQAAYDLHLIQGRSVNIVLHNIRDLVGPVLVRSKTEGITGKLWGTAGRIRQYRNVLAHNPLIPKLIGEQNVVYLPRPEKLNDYDLWSTAQYGNDVESDYEPGLAIVEGLLVEFETYLDGLWAQLIALLTEWRNTDKYAAMEPPGLDRGESFETGVRIHPTPLRRRPTGGSPFMPSGTSVVSDIPDWPERDA